MSTENETHGASEKVAARKAVRLVWDEVRRYGATLVDISVASDRVAYHFVARDGRKGEGSVNPRYASAMSEALMESFRMILGVDSVEVTGIGSGTFRLTLAKREPAAVPQAASNLKNLSLVKPAGARSSGQLVSMPARESSDRKSQKTVLVVEDSATFSKVLVRFLERQGFAVQHCEDGRAALEKLQSGMQPDLVISDLHMPHVSGDEFAAQMRAISGLELTPLILLTSDRSVDVELKAIESGVDLFLPKSEDPRIITAYAKRLISRLGVSPASESSHSAPEEDREGSSA